MLTSIYRPEKDSAENTTFNYHVSRVRVRSEHCVGFLKGRWSSLRGLRIQINESAHLHFASLWITTCIILHCFAMQYERGEDIQSDQFYLDGIRIMQEEATKRAARKAAEEEHAADMERVREADRDIELLEGRIKREDLKKELFAYLNE